MRSHKLLPLLVIALCVALLAGRHSHGDLKGRDWDDWDDWDDWSDWGDWDDWDAW